MPLTDYQDSEWYSLGLDYGPSFLGLTEIKADPLFNTASACVPYSAELHQSNYSLHPTTADCALQLLSVAACRGRRRKLNRLVVPISVDHIYIDKTASSDYLEAFAEELESKKLMGSVMGIVDGKVALAFRGCVLAPLNAETSDLDQIESLNVSRLEWTPRLEDIPASDFIRNDAAGPSPAVASEAMAVLCMLETVHEIDSQSLRLRTLYLERYVEWVRRQVQSMVEGTYKVIPEAQEWAMCDSKGRKLLIEKLIDDPAISSSAVVDALVVRVYHHIKELCNDSISGVELLYQDNGLKNFYDIMTGLDLSRLFSTLGHANPTLRVLEVGAGTGGTTAIALDGLTQIDRTRLYSRYCYTDISAGFFPATRERFRGYRVIDFAVLNISQDPLDQGFEGEKFDLVIASNVNF